jgi:hypothetical protein
VDAKGWVIMIDNGSVGTGTVRSSVRESLDADIGAITEKERTCPISKAEQMVANEEFVWLLCSIENY